MFALIVVALAAQERAAAHMREDADSQGAVVLPSGELELEPAEHAVTAQSGAASQTGVPWPTATEPPSPAPTPTPTAPTPAPTGNSDAMNEMQTWVNAVGDVAITTPSGGNYSITGDVPEPDFGEGIEHPNPNEVAAAGLNNPVVLAAKLPNATQTSPSPAPFVADLSVLPIHAVQHPTPLLDAPDDPPPATGNWTPMEFPTMKPVHYTNMTVEERQAVLAKIQAEEWSQFTLIDAASAVIQVIAGEPRRMLTDVESFLLELKRALVGPPMHVMRDAAQTAVSVQDAKVLEAAERPQGETEYVVSVNGIMEYRPPTAHGAVRVVSVLLLLASAIVLGIGWRYGSAPGMYPYVEDCRL